MNFRNILLSIVISMASVFMHAESVVELNTTLGTIKVKLYDDTPLHKENFLKLVKEGYYDGLLFHRVIKDFMVQAGDPQSRNADSTTMLGSGDPSYTIPAEINYPVHYHKYGALAAARTGDQVNPERRSSGSQFYIVTGKKVSEGQLDNMEMRANYERKQKRFNELAAARMEEIRKMQLEGNRQGLDSLRDVLALEVEAQVKDEKMPGEIRRDYSTIGGTPHLDGQYTVFGEVTEGMDVVTKIEEAETGVADRPKSDIRIVSAKVLSE